MYRTKIQWTFFVAQYSNVKGLKQFREFRIFSGFSASSRSTSFEIPNRNMRLP